MSERHVWDLAVVGAGPAGTAAALRALRERPGLSVLLLDRAEFPRDKVCGDGVAPHVVDLLEHVGVKGLMDGNVPVRRLRLERNGMRVSRTMRRPAWVVPREVLDAQLVAAAQEAGAVLRRHRVRAIDVGQESVSIDGHIRARVVVGADGVHSTARTAVGLAPGRMAFALRGYAPVPPGRRGDQVIVFGTNRQPSYAWSFDRGDGLANVGYGELLEDSRARPTRRLLLERLEELLPGSTRCGTAWRGAHLPLSSMRWAHPGGRVLLAGDAAGLVNPFSGEGIYYAVATGLLAGGTAATIRPGEDAGDVYRRAVRALLARHLRHTALVGQLAQAGPVLEAGLLAAADDQQVFDDLVELGLGGGRLTTAVVRGLLTSAAERIWHARPKPGKAATMHDRHPWRDR